MARTKIVIISDVHMSNGESYSWFKDRYPDYMKNMLDGISRDETVKELVLLGDIFDLWLYPVNIKPFQFEDVVEYWKGKTDIIGALQKCADSIPEVYYLNGNHDMTVKAEQIRSISEKIIWTTPDEFNKKYDKLLHFEHGNSVDMFNAPDHSEDALNGYPIGYYITRLVATSAEQKKCRDALSGAIIKHMFTNNLDKGSFLGDLLVHAIIDALMVYAAIEGNPVTDETEIVFPDPTENVTIGDVKKHYHSLLDRWYNGSLSHLYNCMMVSVRETGLDWYAKELITEDKAKAVLFGHTHHGEYLVYEEGKYGNSGCWCNETSGKTPCYIEIEKKPSELIVSLMHWNAIEGKARMKELKSVPLDN